MPPRRPRTSLPSSTLGGGDDVSQLTLPEVRTRLARNTATLSSSLFSPPTASPTLSTLSTSTSGSSDLAKDKLLAAREALLAREQELLLEQMHISSSPKIEHQNGESSSAGAAAESGQARRKSEDVGLSPNGFRSGKQRALEVIRQGEGKLAPGGMILPIDQTLSLSQRDYSNQTAYNLSQLSINHTRSSSPKPRIPSDRHPEQAGSRDDISKGKGKARYLAPPGVGGSADIGGDDEISRASRMARLNAFMSYKGSLSDEEDEDDDDDDDVMDDEEDDNGEGFGYPPKARIQEINGEDERNFPPAGVADGGYDGNGLPTRTVDTIGEEVDEFGEDDEVFAEGNDEYNLDGGDELSGANSEIGSGR